MWNLFNATYNIEFSQTLNDILEKYTYKLKWALFEVILFIFNNFRAKLKFTLALIFYNLRLKVNW